MTTQTVDSDAQLKRDNVRRMCLKHGIYLGHIRNTCIEYWVCDGNVWSVDADSAEIWGYSHAFHETVRRDGIKNFEAV